MVHLGAIGCLQCFYHTKCIGFVATTTPPGMAPPFLNEKLKWIFEGGPHHLICKATNGRGIQMRIMSRVMLFDF